jgi:hypothetical protein
MNRIHYSVHGPIWHVSYRAENPPHCGVPFVYIDFLQAMMHREVACLTPGICPVQFAGEDEGIKVREGFVSTLMPPPMLHGLFAQVPRHPELWLFCY